MKIIDSYNLDEERIITCPKNSFISHRMLLAKDGMGFGMTRTEIKKGDWQTWHYKNHLEACYCVSGTAFIRNEETKERTMLKPGMVYALDNNDKHSFKALQNTTLICVFNPPLTGNEVHNEDGNFLRR